MTRQLPEADVVAKARRAVQDGAGHDCHEWLDAGGWCALCDRGPFRACEVCGRPLLIRPEREAVAHPEAVEQWGRRGDHPSMTIVCPDCHRDIMAWLATHVNPGRN